MVQPRHAAFPEILKATSGGVLCEPGDVNSLADKLEALLLNPSQAQTLGETGRRNTFEKFSVAAMTRDILRVFKIVNRKS